MKRDGIRLLGRMSVVALSTVLASSCSSLPRTPSASAPRSTDVSPFPAPAGRIAQMEFGRRAAFAQCLPPACPAVTPKTLAIEPPAGPDTPPSTDPSLSLDAGETFIAGGPAPSRARRPGDALNSATTAARSTRQVVVHFAFGEASLTATARAQINEVARSLPSASRIAISGRTDSVGSPQSNQTLAVARANAVRDHLRTQYPHLTPAVTLEAQGRCCFAASNDTPQGRALNRRVEIVFERDGEDLR